MTVESSPVPSFDQSLQELERIVKALEDGQIPLEQAIDLYAKGHALCQKCTEILQDAQLKVDHIRNSTSHDRPSS